MGPWSVQVAVDPTTNQIHYYVRNDASGETQGTFFTRDGAEALAASLNTTGATTGPAGAGSLTGTSPEEIAAAQAQAALEKQSGQRLSPELGIPLGLLDADGNEISDDLTPQGAYRVRAGILDRIRNLAHLSPSQRVDPFGQPTTDPLANTADAWRRSLSDTYDAWGKEITTRIKTQDALLSSAATRARAGGSGGSNVLGYAQIAAANARAEAAARAAREEFDLKRQDEQAAVREARRKYIADLEDQMLQRRLQAAQNAPPNLPYPPGFGPGEAMQTVAQQLHTGYTPLQTSALTTQVDFAPTQQAIDDYRNAPAYPEPLQVPQNA